jgi:hypothetical protein
MNMCMSKNGGLLCIRIIAKLDAILATNPNPQQAYDQIETLINNIKTVINNNPNTHLNDLIF